MKNWPTIILAVVVLLLLYPAYRGLFELPGLQSDRTLIESEISGLRKRAAELETRLSEAQQRASRGSGSRILRLPDDEAVVIVPQQAELPVEITHRLGGRGSVPADAPITILLKRQQDSRELWRLEAKVGEVWDPESGTVGLLIPTGIVSRGEYRLEIMSSEKRVMGFVGTFRVE